MPRLDPIDLCIANLQGAFQDGAIGFMEREEALEELKKMSGEDFGFDAEKWRDWKKSSWRGIPNGQLKDIDEIKKIMRQKRNAK